MTKEVLINIKGLQFIENDNVGEGQDPPLQDHSDEEVSLVTPGTYHCRDGNRYIKYDEIFEGIEDPASNLLTIKENILEVRKKGAVDVHMVFAKDKKTIADYTTPYGTLHMNIITTDLIIHSHKDQIDIQASYILEANEEKISNNILKISITSN